MPEFRLKNATALLFAFAAIGFALSCLQSAIADESLFTWDNQQSKTLSSDAGLKIFWWNIHWGSLHPNGSNEILQTNLSNLVDSKFAPDVLAFAEYSHAALGAPLFSKLQTLYPYHQDFPYPGSTDQGMGVFSKFPFQVSSLDTIGSRDLIILDLTVNGKSFTLIPTHIEDTWRDYKKNHSALLTIEQVFIGTDNPVWDQVEAFRTQLENRLGHRLSEKNLILFGDFNSVKPSLAYDKIGYGLNDVIEGFAGTFPQSHSDDQSEFPFQVQIDHGFVSPGTPVKSAQILPLLGSDHYALEMILKE